MSVTKDNTLRMHEQIRKDFQSHSNKKKNGVKIYTNEYIITILSDKYFKSPRTIENIVFHRV